MFPIYVFAYGAGAYGAGAYGTPVGGGGQIVNSSAQAPTNVASSSNSLNISANASSSSILAGQETQYKKLLLSPFTKNLSLGQETSDVKRLQVFLNALGFVLAPQGVGAPGHETNYFGNRTANAVKRFQDAHPKEILIPAGLKVGTGFFGVLSRTAALRHVITQ